MSLLARCAPLPNPATNAPLAQMRRCQNMRRGQAGYLTLLKVSAISFNVMNSN